MGSRFPRRRRDWADAVGAAPLREAVAGLGVPVLPVAGGRTLQVGGASDHGERPALASAPGGTQHPRSASRWEAAAQGRSPRGLWVSADAAFTDVCRGHPYLAGSHAESTLFSSPHQRDPDPSLATPGLLSDPGSASPGRFMKTASLTV